MLSIAKRLPNMSLDEDDIKNYLLQVGCKIEYPALVNAFKRQLCNKDPKVQNLIRTQFKDHVNKLAKVTLENNTKFIVLRPEFQQISPPTNQSYNWTIEACKRNYSAMVEMLRHDPKLASQKDLSNGYTALHWAAKFGNLDVIKLIAGKYQISPNIKSHAGYTPLHLACMFDRFDAYELLLKSFRADPRIRDNYGRFPQHYIKTTIELENS